MSIRELCIQHPLLVSNSINSKRASVLYGIIYDHEIDNPDSIFAEQDGEEINSRLYWSNRHPVNHKHIAKNEYIQSLKRFTALSYKINKNESTPQNDMDHTAIKKKLLEREYLYPDVSKILTVNNAEQILSWGTVSEPVFY